MYNVMDVARFIVNYSIDIGRPVSNLKLQKLLYFVQASFIERTGKPCFEEPIVHWRHGPVVESVYQKYKAYGAENITDKELEYLAFSFDATTMTFNASWTKYNEDIFESSHLQLIKSIVQKYKEFSPWEMVDLTHKEKAWINTSRNDEITVEMIKRYYS